jgi:hypothetical protein
VWCASKLKSRSPTSRLSRRRSRMDGDVDLDLESESNRESAGGGRSWSWGPSRAEPSERAGDGCARGIATRDCTESPSVSDEASQSYQSYMGPAQQDKNSDTILEVISFVLIPRTRCCVPLFFCDDARRSTQQNISSHISTLAVLRGSLSLFVPVYPVCSGPGPPSTRHSGPFSSMSLIR